MSEAECKKLASDKQRSVDKISWTQKEYWVNKGMSESEAISKISEIQKTFSLDICIQKYGEEEGRKRWTQRQEKWISKVFNDETYIGGGKSMIGKEFNDNLLEAINGKYSILHGDNEKFIKCSTTKRAYKYDFTILDLKIIFEFNGDYWHCNPEFWTQDMINKSKNQSAKDIWEYDEYKRKLAEKNGYTVYTIWESEYRKSPFDVIKKCLDFINEKKA